MRLPVLWGLGALVLLFSAAMAATVALLLRVREHRRLVDRLTADAPHPDGYPGAADQATAADGSLDTLPPWRRRLRQLRSRTMAPIMTRMEPLAQRMPAPPKLAERLVLAGHDAPGAPVLLRLMQVLGAASGALAGGLLLLPTAPAFAPVLAGVGALLGGLVPLALLDRQVVRRQQRIRQALPDALDLLVVCVEAGVSLEMAIQRVGRELGRAHPVLAAELLDMSRRLSAGMPREQAFQSLHLRSGVDDLRTLATHLIQSERWGTSLATVLRTAAQDLRRRRRRAAEQRAATAATRMLAPLALCIFPTIFVVILGPAALRIMAAFREMAQ